MIDNTILLGALAAFSPLTLGLMVFVGWRWQRALVRVAKETLAEALTVVIPARNEEERLPATLDALLREPSPQLRVFVVDDRSSDGTAAAVRERAGGDPRVVLLQLDDDPPPGQFGKPRALAAGVRASAEHGAFVLFLDADVVLEEGCLGGLLMTARLQGAHALSGVPALELPTLVEQCLVPAFVALVAARYPTTRVHDALRRDAFLNGQVMLVQRTALQAVGGIEAVGTSVLEDVALAARLKHAGFRIRLADLRTLARTRMYANLRDIAEGFGKNARAVFGPAAVVAVGAQALLLAWAPWLALGISAVRGDAFWVAILGVLATSMLQLFSRQAVGLRAWPALLAPVTYAFVAAVYLRAALTRQVRWRGRTYPAG